MRYVPLLLFALMVVGGGALIGTGNVPDDWYRALRKPWFNPPDAVFGPVWMLLYLLIAIAGWRVWTRARTGGAMSVWWLQLGLNFLWSPVFFTLHAVGAALIVVVALLAAVVAFIALVWDRDRIAALLFVPYAAWVAFAAMLNAAIWLLN